MKITTPKISQDWVPSIRLDFMPDIIQSFLKRLLEIKRHDLYNLMLTGIIYLVPKSHNSDFEFRYSFSYMEYLLAKQRNYIQNILYCLLKSLYYRNIRLIEYQNKYISSYLLKTCFLWYCERKSINYFIEDNLKIILMEILTDLMNCMYKRTCYHYFVSTENLLLNMPHELLDQCYSKVHDIYENIDKYLQDLVEAKINMFNRQGVSKRLIDSEIGEKFRCLFEKYFSINSESNENLESYMYTFFNQMFLYDREMLFVKKLVFELKRTDRYFEENNEGKI
ncbi:unnamed protein product [Didymodactylos carnosus]|uniref:Mab-21-like HhH/H2TH-like domain-containing protein n=1 Tax=Didymodactylos carnosus TaxID=1234261 RepID=A0A8S2V9G1_9BILA|nr:unnamed protein product [Didymodactylos carnosus]CAF4375922.1 unnamed protein product [Didymodactylos carnosus]